MIPGLGSSPLTQGALIHCLSRRLHLRLIPAHAGSTNASRATTTEVSAHPRSRGEHRRGRIFRPCECGSSPLTRGARDGIRHGIPPWRLIPAHAGSTSALEARSRRRTAHPRSRGEHGEGFAAGLLDFGSSPLTRGTRQEIEKSESWKGLIPARAGNTTGKFHPGGKGTAHPRLCWEHGTPFSVSQAALGSSPLAQGTFLEGLLCLRPARLIPARAGNTGHAP